MTEQPTPTNLDLRDRPRLNKLLRPNMFQETDLTEAEKDYFLEAVPSKENLRINLVINGKEEEVYIPEFLGAQITKQKTAMKTANEGYKMWACCHDPVLQCLGFFDSPNVEETALTKREMAKVKDLEESYPRFSEDFI